MCDPKHFTTETTIMPVSSQVTNESFATSDQGVANPHMQRKLGEETVHLCELVQWNVALLLVIGSIRCTS